LKALKSIKTERTTQKSRKIAYQSSSPKLQFLYSGSMDRLEKSEFQQLGVSRAFMASAGDGMLGGMVGQCGSFILIPLMICYVQISTRIAIGSNLAIVALASAAGFLGKV
jgi:uncharacterized membrane protein YfcA